MLLPLLACAALPQDTFGAHDPYHPGPDEPRLVTPQWVGEEGVDAVVVLSIDDMRAPEPYDRYMHLILERLEAIDGRAPVSVFVNSLDPAHPLLQTWLERGLSLEVHTVDHPCPLLHAGDFARARSTVERCVDLLGEVPNSTPVAYRMPCCDSINSLSPRFFAEIFEQRTESGNFLTIDTSVFTLFDEERFRQHVPADRSFVNTIEAYPFPYIIGDRTWELPCIVPSDWEAQHLRGPNHPETVADIKAALDRAVEVQGVFTLVFHPHNWIQARQVVEIIDHAVDSYGERVKFLNLREVQERLDATVGPLRDLDGDGLLDIVGREHTTAWSDGAWQRQAAPFDPREARFGVAPTGTARALLPGGSWQWSGGAWSAGPGAPSAGGHLRDLDGDGISELLTPDAVLRATDGGGWTPLGFAPPVPPDDASGTRFVDLDGDGLVDIVASNEEGASVHRLLSMERGWSAGGATVLPPFTVDGRERGAWVHSEHVWWQNEDTAHLPNHVDRRSFAELLAAVTAPPATPEESLALMEVDGAHRVELAAAEPLVRDPVAFDWDAHGALYVVEMGDYPLGVDGPRGRVRRLVDEDGDWRYDRATTFLDGLAFPTGVAPWRDGVLITCAPDILFARDTTGDGAADEVRVVVSGFGEGNQQHRVNGLWWGLDNRYHGANGDSGGVVAGVNLSGRDFSLDPDAGVIQAEYGQTQFGKTRDDWGSWFGGNNSYQAWHWPLAMRYLSRAPQVVPPPSYLPVLPGGQPVSPIAPVPARFNDPGGARRFTSACSPMVYRDDALPFAGDLFVCEPVHNLVHRRSLVAEGRSFRTEAPEAEFLASRDPAFRPTMVRTGPDGAIWIADMTRAVIEHPEWIPDDWEARLDLGAGQELGRLYRVVPEGGAVASFTWPGTQDAPALVERLRDGNGWVRDLAHRLLVERGADVAGALEELVAGEVAGDAPATARLHALCALDGLGALREPVVEAALADEHPGVRRHAVRLAEGFPHLLAALADGLDADPKVRLQLACSLQGVDAWDTGPALVALLNADGDDPHLRAAALASGRSWTASDLLALEREELRRELVLHGARVSGTTGLLPELEDLPAAARFELLAGMLEASPGLSLAGVEDLVAFAQDPASDGELGDRVRVLARAGDEVPSEALLDLLALGAPVGLLAGRDDPELAQRLIERWRDTTPGRRGEVLDLLLARRSFTDVTVSALERGELRPSDFDATRAELGGPPARDPAPAGAARGGPGGSRAAVVEALRPQVEALEGDPLRGREVFRASCAPCHRLDGLGEVVGPDLRALSDRSHEALLVAVLDPNRAVEARYLGFTALTHDGLVYTGVVADETDTSVTLRGAGVDEVLLRADLEALRTTSLSQMPEGLEVELGPQGLADVIAYIAGDGVTPKVFNGNEPRTIAVGAQADLPAAAAEIHGPTLVFEGGYGNLGYWHELDDLAAWSLEVEEAGRYAVEVDYACPSNPGSNVLVFRAEGSELAWSVEPTGSWSTYRSAAAGDLHLPAGRALLTARAAEGLSGYLIDLRTVRLRKLE